MNEMLFDIEFFERLLKLAFRNSETFYSYEEALHVFRYYFSTYELIFDEPHPMISRNQISAIIERMPYADLSGDRELSPKDYEEIIDQHFATKYKACDYNINHFFSGRIREYRLYEISY